jgi:hypothetical protein
MYHLISTHLGLPEHTKGIFFKKVENNGKNHILFQTVLNTQHVRQMFTYPDSAIGVIQSYVY